ncbi:DUF2249 domain-containing protein [Halovenus sp. HT40]|uniref:DUF2249 domain-containing protein n=1 Tax=Halovenus sp. HT40 TaxID=3126691 RepID=UPI00300E72D1
MLTEDRAIDRTGAPTGTPVERLDVRELGPPEPLKQTLETLVEMDGGVLVQYNDRVPQFLFPKLDDRGYEYETIETDDAVVTTIWES